MSTKGAIEIAEGYFRGLNAKDLSRVPFAPDVVFECPITPKLSGVSAVLEFLEGVFSVIKDVRLRQCVPDGEYVSVRFELDTVYGLIPASDRLRIVNGQIKELRPYYDPRPLKSAVAGAGGPPL
jgi:SnoaL-like protein